ncbi:glutamate receptor 2.9-like [Impatiens glandulifera]|uniref:glutamate receptor 2.9-like n=1 Tax=Impatiens glandulifera TaxID=253017 RepID=UPI001FB0A0A2|nr:glutamate receptor 2.9-like [Impatiens glandulifera]
MILPVKNQSPNRLTVLLKPFSCQMWLVTAATFSYTTFIIWLMERHSNPEFGGSWSDQLANVLCFMFSCLFSSHDDRISRNYTRVVVLSWIFVAVILTQSYTTTFISMVNDPTRTMPDVMDIEWLKAKNAKVGFQVGLVRPFVKEVLGFKTQNLKEITNIGDTLKKFKNKNISASFLELNLAKKFLHSTSGFVGLGFMNTHQVHDECITESGHTSYQPIIQVLSDNNILQRLHETWVAFPLLDYPILGNIQKDSADLQSFMPAFVFSWIISTLSSILFLFCLVKETVKDFIIKLHIDILELTQCLVKYVKT